MALNLKHQTEAEFAARYWRRLDSALQRNDKLVYYRMVWWLWTRIQAGDLTSDQVRLSYNAHSGRTLTPAQWNNLVTTRLVPIKDRYLAFIAEGGL
jgi:hypothetical protein